MRAPQSVLFCCDQNSVRSPMAEALMKHLVGSAIYVQSAGVFNERDIDGFAIAVCRECGIELDRHRSRSFDEMRAEGEDISSFDLIVTLSAASHRRILEMTQHNHMVVENWDVLDPTAIGESREARLSAYRMTRDQLKDRIRARFASEDPR